MRKRARCSWMKVACSGCWTTRTWLASTRSRRKATATTSRWSSCTAPTSGSCSPPPVPYEPAVAIVAAAAAGLDHAHRRCSPDGKPLRLVHRDVSLSNIMVSHTGTVKVIDFGIACASVSEHHTNPGVVRGKASYMSPEQALGEEVDLRTDVFALGVVL